MSSDEHKHPVERLLRLGLTHQNAGALDNAEHAYRTVLERSPDNAAALHLLGTVIGQKGRHEEGLTWIDRALAIQPADALAHSNRGGLLLALGRVSDAVMAYERGLALRPADPVALWRLGMALQASGELDGALRRFEAALQLQPGMPQAQQARDALLHGQRGIDAAVHPGVSWDPRQRLQAHIANAESCVARRAYGRAADEFAEAFRMAPGMPLLAGHVLYNRLRAADWHDLDQWRATIEQGLARHQPVVPPLAWLAGSGDPASLREAAQVYGAALHGQAPMGQRPPPAGARSGRLRVAYLSADFKEHPMMRALAEVFELHDRSRFEVHAYAYGHHAPDALSARLAASFERFVDVRQWSDDQIAADLARRGIDIAVDLNGFTEQGRTGILQSRPVPVTVNYLGFPGTSALPFMDYIVGDATVIPHGHERFYSEQVVRLPDCYLPCDRRGRNALPVPTRGALGLPQDATVFCAFSNTYKITPPVFGVWMRLLRATPGSVLWLVKDSDDAAERLRAHARELGVDGARLVMAGRAPFDQYLARYRQADLFLDTHPYNALATTVDALWAGLPVLTVMGDTYVGRGAASILRAAGLGEGVTSSLAEYESRAMELAADPHERVALRKRLAAQRESAALFDTPRYVRHLEDAYLRMAERARSGLEARGFDVPADGTR